MKKAKNQYQEADIYLTKQGYKIGEVRLKQGNQTLKLMIIDKIPNKYIMKIIEVLDQNNPNNNKIILEKVKRTNPNEYTLIDGNRVNHFRKLYNKDYPLITYMF